MIKQYLLLSSVVLLINLNYILSEIILGVDLGSENIKATVLKPGKPFQMVENIQSKTATAAGVGFKPDERLFGPDTLIYKARYPKQVVNYLDRYLSEKFDSEKIKKYLHDHSVSYDISENTDRLTIDFKLKFKNEDYIFSPEELYGMLFRYIKFITEKFVGQRVDEVYVSVPSSWGYKKRHGLFQSVKLAGLSLIGTPTQNTAAAVHFYTDKNFNDTQNYIFYTIGSTYTQASLVSFQNQFTTVNNKTIETKHINVIAEVCDDHLGSRDFDFILVNKLIDEFDSKDEKKGKPSSRNDYRVPERILPFAIKYKEVLSANKQVGVNILGIESGLNLNSNIKKEDFEEASKGLFEKINLPIERLFELTGLTIENIDQIELLGGGVRIPKIQEILIEKYGEKKIGTHMNGDDSIALGTAYLFANSTRYFKVNKKIIGNTGLPYEIKIYINPILSINNSEYQLCNENEEKEDLLESIDCVKNLNKSTILYKLRHGFDIARTVSFKYDSDISISVYEKMEGQDNELNLLNYTISGFESARKELLEHGITSTPKVNLRFRLTEAGLLNLKADIIYEYNLYFQRFNNTDKNNTSYRYIKEFVNPLNEEELKAELEILNADGKNETDPEYKKISNIGKVKKQETTISLIVNKEFSYPKPLNRSELDLSKQKLDKIDKIEEERLKNIEAKNALEAEIYLRKEWVDQENPKLYLSLEEIEEINKKVKEVYDWYEDEGYSADTLTLRAKMNELKGVINPAERKIKKEIEAKLKKELDALKNETISNNNSTDYNNTSENSKSSNVENSTNNDSLESTINESSQEKESNENIEDKGKVDL